MLGVITGGSLTRGVEIRLDSSSSPEDLAAGRYVTIDGNHSRFFGMITDVELRTTSPGLAAAPPEGAFVRAVLQGTAMYAVLKVSLMLRVDLVGDEQPHPVKTVPAHFSPAREASQSEMAQVFGEEDNDHFLLGTPLDMELKVCLDYQRFIERSNAIFGKTGTGKTFTTRMILADLIQKSAAQRDESKRCANLIFDMHNDYGWEATSEGTSRTAAGLKQLADSNVLLMTLDEPNARRRQIRPDHVVTIAYGDVEPADIAILQETLRLTDLSVQASYALAGHFGQSRWLEATLALRDADDSTQDLLSRLNIHPGTLQSLRRGLQSLTRHGFMVPTSSSDTPRLILNDLLRGRNIVLEFGRYGNEIASYMLVANILTRRIYNEFRDRTETAIAERTPQPNHLVITIEEAHKFLSPAVAGQTIFGEIAREMRKYNVTLMVVDQRPSVIDDEVLSQIGTRIICLLDNERDVDAVLSGVSGRNELRAVIAKLDSRQQALVLGHAVPMPVVVKLKDYDTFASGYDAFVQSLRPPAMSARELLYND